MITLDQLRGFCCVAEEGSFSRAARRMYLTQPAISMQVRALESDLGEQLFDRSGRRIEMTDAGKVLYERARDILERVDQARADIDEMRGLPRGRLTVACSDTLSTYVLAPVLSRYIRDCPGVEITILNKTSPETVQMVLDRAADVGLAALPVAQSGVTVEPLLQYQDKAVCSRSHPLARVSSVRLAQLAQHRLLLLETGSRSRMLLDQAFAAASIWPEAIMGLGSVEVVKSFAAIGLGVGVVPSFALQKRTHRTGLAVIDIDKLPTRQIGIILRSGRRPSLACQVLLKHLKAGGPKGTRTT